MIKSLYVCDTLIQIMIASCVQKQLKEDAAIIMTDHTADMYEVYKRMKVHSTLFKDVFFVEAKKYSAERDKYDTQYIDQVILDFLRENGLVDCNRILISTLDRYMVRLFKVYKHDLGNKNICGAIIDEGPGIYCDYANVIQKYKYKSDFKEIYLCDPSLLSWTPEMEICKVDITLFSDEQFVKELNDIFGYYDMEDEYKEKYIVMSSGYNEIVAFNNTRELLLDLEEAVGKENILIKIHPRVDNSLYEKYGYKTNKNRAIPWEIIALNSDLSDKVVITSSSSGLFSPMTLFGKKQVGITVMNIAEQADPVGYLSYMKKYLVNKYSDCVYAPNTREEFKKILSNL